MEIKTVFIVAMLAVSRLAQAQVSQDAFEKAVDFVNCKSVELSLNESPTAGVKTQFQAKCTCQNYPGFDAIRLAIPKSEKKTIELSDEINSLKTDESKENVVKFLTEDVFANQTQYPKLFDFADKRKDKHGKDNPAFAELKTELKTELKKISDEQAKAQTIIDTKTRPDSLEQKTKSKIREKGWFDGFTLQIDIFSILISVVLTFIIVYCRFDFLKKFKKSSSESISGTSELQCEISEKSDDTSSEIKNLKEEQKRFKKNLKEEFEQFKEEMRKQSREIENLKNPLPTVQPKYEHPEVKTGTFFLSVPNSDGSFNASSASLVYKEGASIYKFTKIGNNRAEFQIDDREASVRLALSYPDKSIDPVCEALNAVNLTAKQITTVEPGQAELVNDRWVVIKNQKSKIRYEV
ncbi:MAG: hypothetical protein CRN43_00825 [Candidatus Nephrothrix sp. EaCA]|nr:MAG: hypothetical protein CRN43_00825 [Candidatus Nephrothrix sp. EaCA]